MSRRSGPLAPGIAFITGGARGLGNAIAVSFAKEGASGVAIVDIQHDVTFQEGRKKVEEFGCECLTIRADVTKEEDMERAVKEAVEKFGRIDYAANFAGIVGPGAPISEIDVSEWQKTQDVNSKGVLLATKYEMRQMMKQESIEVELGRVLQRGSIVNCASVNSLQSMPGTSAYTASKHACHGITKAAALEGRSCNIRVNAVSPGFLLTKMIESSVLGGDMKLGQEMWSTFEARQGRKAQFEEVGDVVVLMSLPRMSLVNGQNLFIDGGFTINESNT
ncbi:NAD(P)-binding protein [Lindgomyces ingoldianus]|uniref:NAD(P)-binding protein n=1 Tax=Lindgomyces ingoldianus TaxID=673940 RepID=A0ACB6Q8Z4_9PLEO|nr:NAD(P)-binding protein [Lindgomyces ingoldianus]KAF2463058.1 NAD(P)-binding protein [Lindgomyces ingoldianus]